MNSTAKRTFLAGATFALLALFAPAARAQTTPTSYSLQLSPDQISALEKSLEKRHQQYDPDEQLLASKKGGGYDYNSYLRNQIVHPTRESLSYARALLDTGNPKWQARAFDILRRIAQFQVSDPQNEGYGVWGKYAEEPLDKAPYIDRNWADFLGKDHLHVALYHQDRLPPDLKELTKTVVLRAAEAIKRRNVGMGYTNIAVMGTYVTLLAADKYDDAELKAYALDRLRRLVDFTRERGGFREYNSPTYTMVALSDLARFVNDVRDPAARPLVEELHRFAWLELATHFHPPTRSWAGPYSRAYGVPTNQSTANFVERHTGAQIDWGLVSPEAEAREAGPMCPPDLEQYFLPLTVPRTQTRVFEPEGEKPLVGTTYLHPKFALGTVNWSDMWNQKHNLLAHWGALGRVGYLDLRFLHDGYDFQTVRFHAQQREGRALVALNLATDGGDKHPSLDKIKDATVKGRDFRVRFELGGAAKDAQITAPATLSQPARIVSDGVTIQIAAPFARWGELEGRWESGRDKDKAWLDIVLYDGPEKTWKLDELQQVAVGLALQIAPDDAPIVPVEVSQANERLALSWNAMEVSVAMKPQGWKALLESARMRQQ